MEPDRKSKEPGKERGEAHKRPEPKPEWADGLQKLYKSVVDEPLPDSFKDLLSKLDDKA